MAKLNKKKREKKVGNAQRADDYHFCVGLMTMNFEIFVKNYAERDKNLLFGF